MMSLFILQAFCTSFGKLSATTLTADTLSWSWEVTTTYSTMTKTCTFEFTGPLTINWGDGKVQTLSDTLSGTTVTHMYGSITNFNCSATGTGIVYFKADSKRLLTLDPTKCPALTYLSCTSNQLKTLDVSKNPELLSLYCASNEFSVLSVNSCTKLQTLTCSDNKLSRLDVSSIPDLKKLTCHTNLLTSLKIFPAGSLNYVSCTNCSLQVAELDTLFARLPRLDAVSTSKNLYVLNNPGAANCNVQQAILKNWTPDKVVSNSVFYMLSTTCLTGKPVELDICLTNPVKVVAFELDFVFPTGFKLDTIQSRIAAARKGNHLLSIAQTSANQYKIMAYSLSTGDFIKGNNGVVLQLFGTSPDSASIYSIQMKQAVLVDSATNMSNVTVTHGSLTVYPLSMNGDVNDDKLIDVTDIVNLVAYINGRIPSGFVLVAADLDNNGFLNVADIARLVVIINTPNVTLRSLSMEPAPYERAVVSYDRLAAENGNNLYLRQATTDQNCIELCLDNRSQVQACQVDISLPSGVSIRTNEVRGNTLRQNGHLIQINQIGKDKYRLISYALRPDAAFKGDTGVLISLPLQVSENLPPSNYPIYLDAPILTDMNLSTTPAKGFDLSATVGKPLEKPILSAGADDLNGLWVQGQGLTEVFVWNLLGKMLDHRQLNGANSYKVRLPKGIYMVRAGTDSKKELQQKVMVP